MDRSAAIDRLRDLQADLNRERGPLLDWLRTASQEDRDAIGDILDTCIRELGFLHGALLQAKKDVGTSDLEHRAWGPSADQ